MTVVKYRSQQHSRRGPEESVKETLEARVCDRVDTQVAQARYMSSSFYVASSCIWLARGKFELTNQDLAGGKKF